LLKEKREDNVIQMRPKGEGTEQKPGEGTGKGRSYNHLKGRENKGEGLKVYEFIKMVVATR